ncbi:hypothetical protein CEW81_07375 [Kluyvera genomosp. 3]|uniref:Uncharacterized protein n=1 Tax=Kluyvera genomosp. 3 TaxID=2774055 RepID=A0A248KGQ9_9ENTR|nr:hypothetical protein CEW81_07375 [Kluyvera genomosp. 3]
MVKSLSVMGITDSDFPMSSITGRANLLLTTSIGGGVYAGIKKGARRLLFLIRRKITAYASPAWRWCRQSRSCWTSRWSVCDRSVP